MQSCGPPGIEFETNALKDCYAALIRSTGTGNTPHNTRCTRYIVRRMASTLIFVCFFLILFLSPCPDQMVDRRREMMSAALIVSDEPQRHIPSEDLD